MQVRARSAPALAEPRTPLTVEDTVPSGSGSWRRSLAREVPIAELQQKFGWTDGSWQAELLQAADGAATSPASRRGNGSVSAAEVNRYLAEPEEGRFLTSAAVQQQREALEQRLVGRAQAVDVDAFDTGWQETVARRADQLGNANGKLSRAELNTFLTDMKAGKVEGTAWVPDQQQAVFESKVAERAGEVDPLRPTGGEGGVALVKEYMRLSMDEAKNVPTFVSYLLSAADLQETPVDVSREKSHFRKDPALGEAGVAATDYTGSGFDRGHMKPAEGSPTQEAMDESHLMSNVAPQHPDLNRQAWRTLEDAVNDLVEATGGKAHIVTGNLYLNAQGKPLPPEALETLGTNTRRVAVPTHQFKSVLLELPNGHLSMFAYMVPNVKDAPTKKEDITPFLEASRTSVDALEDLLGQDLYAQLPASLQARLESDATARIAFQRSSRYEAASLLWPGR